jgi:hypothetical protein
MKKNELERFIKQKKEYRGLTNVYISKLCTWRCIQKNIVTANHCGNPSPMALVEQYIVSLMQQMAKMWQPLNVSKGLSLANCLVEGTEWKKKIVKFKSKRGRKPFAADVSKFLFWAWSGILVSGSTMVMKLRRKRDKRSPRIGQSGMMKCMKQWRNQE